MEAGVAEVEAEEVPEVEVLLVEEASEVVLEEEVSEELLVVEVAEVVLEEEEEGKCKSVCIFEGMD